MAKIKITTTDGEILETQGQMTVSLDKTTDGEILCIGSLALHQYIEEIEVIESSRYLLTGVDVYKEIFGTNDFNILYEFTLTEKGEFTVKEDTLDEKEIDGILNEMYLNEDCNKWE